MQVGKLSDVAGIEVSGVDLSRRTSAAEDRELGRLYDEYGLVVFRDQRLTKRQLLDAGRPFGGVQIDVPAVVPDPEVPGIITISTRGPNGDVIPEDPNKILGDIQWHTDQAYVPAPNRGKLLYAVEVPEEGGMTGFIDGHLTYDALSSDMKNRIENLHVIQSWNHAEDNIARQRAYVRGGSSQMSYGRFRDMAYPMAYNHPISGKKVLNVPPLWAAGVVEMPGPEGNALLEELKQHVVQTKFQYWHRYRRGDALIWDNWRFLHAASGTPGRYPRTLYGITIKPGPVLGYELPKAA